MSFWKEIAEFIEHIIFPPHDDPDPDPCCTIKIRQGWTLWGIAEHFTDDGSRYQEIVAANPEVKFDDKFTIYVGQELKIPCSWVDALALHP